MQLMTIAERTKLFGALDSNAAGTGAILLGRDTSFAGLIPEEDIEEETAVIDAIRSTPTHY